jgi:hypothetical protein
VTAVPRRLRVRVQGVTGAKQTRERVGGRQVEQRLYECANGYWLGARRGGVLHLAVEGRSWEVFTLDRRRVPIGGSAGFVDDAGLARLLKKLAALPPAS